MTIDRIEENDSKWSSHSRVRTSRDDRGMVNSCHKTVLRIFFVHSEYFQRVKSDDLFPSQYAT